jgi:molybdopterin converting factor small subunit
MSNGTMITLHLLGNLAAANGERVLEWELKEPTSLGPLLLAHQEEIPDVIRLWKETECMFTVGVRIAAESTTVKDGDIVKVTPHNSQFHAADFPFNISSDV